MTYVIGLTGGIGSGKTVVSDHFAELDVPIIDTDMIARDIVKPGEQTLQDLVSAFGERIRLNTGELDRAALRSIAFANEENKKILDSITHPVIGERTLEQMATVTFQYCILVVPLLTPASQFMDLMQRVITVTAEHATKMKRVMQRSNLSHEEVQRIMATQLSDAERHQFSTDIITNNGTVKEVHAQVEHLHQQFLELSA